MSPTTRRPDAAAFAAVAYDPMEAMGTPPASDARELGTTSPLLRMMLRSRLFGASAAAVGFAALGLIWRWPQGFVVAGLALAVLLHAAWRRHITDRLPVDVLVVDASAVAAMVIIVEPPIVAIIPPVVTFLVTAVLMLSGVTAVAVVTYTVGITIAAALVVQAGGPPEWDLASTVALTATTSIIFLPSMVPFLRLAARQEQERDEYLGRLFHYERAIASCAQALLTEGTDEAVGEALGTILDAAIAETVFVERNVHDPVLGPCSHMVYEASNLPQPVDYERWANVPWSKMPMAHARLSRGEPFAFRIDELEGEEAALYEGLETESELDVPIFYEDEWLGVIGFADRSSRRWTDGDIGVLQVVAQMMAHAWHREAQREHLEHMVRSRDEFVASVSHRLRTPLTTVVAVSQLLRDEESLDPEEREHLIDSLAEQSLDIANVVEDLLVAARTDSGTAAIASRPLDLRAAVEEALAALPSGSTPEVQMEEGTWMALGDPVRVRQILRNLLDNAARHGGPNISVEFVDNGTLVSVRVSDDGPGVSIAEDRVFEPFERADQFPGMPGQLGLGLTISRRLARMMGGDLTYSRDDGTTTFSLDLPKAS